MSQPVIITAALTGAEVTREQQPNLPLSPEEVATAAAECAAAGAAIVHIHARRADGSSTQAPEAYRALIEAIRARCDVIVQVSTGGAVGMSAEERLGPVTLAPEMATLSMGSVNFGDDVFLNLPTDMARYLSAMREHGVVPEFEIFDAGMLATLARWVKKGLVAAPAHVDFVLGVPGGLPGTPAALQYLVSQLPEGLSFSVAGVGACQLNMNVMSLAMGGHVRVGFEDNIFLRRGERAHSNAQFVERMARIASAMDRPPATAAQARAMLGITPPGLRAQTS